MGMQSAARLELVVAIMVIAGALGGYAAFLTTPATAPADPGDRPSLLAYVVLGIAATLCVPLFLSLVQSALIPNILASADAKAFPFSDLLTFVGLCVLAAIAARRFLDTLLDRVLRDVTRLQRQSRQHARQIAKAAEAAETSLDLVDEQDSVARATPLEPFAPATAHMKLPEAEQMVLELLAPVTFGTVSGVARNLSLDRPRAAALLQELAAKKLVEQTVSPKTNGARWRITELGAGAIC